jgi:glycosyltransferase involved in cell wall biosynthesis
MMASEIPNRNENEEVAPRGSGRRAVIVTGMHRSGTSAISRALALLGLQLPATPMGSNSGNRLGHWGESARVYELHEELFETTGLTWDGLRRLPPEWFASPEASNFRRRMALAISEEFPGERPFLLKDPRICVLLPLWNELFDEHGIEPGFVLAVRNPLEVAASLSARDGLAHSQGLLLWLHHSLEAERHTRGRRRAFVSYDAMLEDWRSETEAIARRIGVDWPKADDPATAEAIDGFLSSGERHHSYTEADLDRRGEVAAWIGEAHALLLAACGSGQAPDPAGLDRISAELGAAETAFVPLLELAAARGPVPAERAGDEREAGDRIAAYEAANAELAERVEALEAELAARSQALDAEIASAPKRGSKRGAEWAAAGIRVSPSGRAPAPAPRGSAGARRIQTARQIVSWAKNPALGARRVREFLALRNSPEFDRSFYLRRNPDVANKGMNPIIHYIEHGARAGLDPSPTFSTSGYLRSHPELDGSTVNPLYQYLRAKRSPRSGGQSQASGEDADHPHPHPAISKGLGGESPVALPVTQELRARAREALEVNPLEVSVVVPTHNRSARLETALASAFSQTYPALEVIVCDDGGNDGTAEMLGARFGAELAVGTLRLLRHETRRGSSAARNTALATARGDVVAYLDSDNAWQPDFLQIMAGRLAEGDDVAAAYCGLRTRGDDGAEPREVFDRFDRDQLLTRNYIDINSFVHRRRLYEQLGGFDEELTRLVDWDLLLRYTRNYPAAAVPHCLVDYYAGEEGGRISHTEDFDSSADRIRRRYARERLQAGITPLRLAYVLWDYPALSQTFVLTEIEELLDQGHDVRVYFHQAPDRSAEPGFSVPSSRVADAVELAELLREDGRTLVHSHFAYPAARNLAWPAAQAAGIPFTFTVHAVDVFHRANRARNQVAEMAADELCIRVFAIGEFHREFLIAAGVPAAKISIARPAARLTEAAAEAIAGRLGRSRRVVGCITRFVEKKGVDDLIRAAVQLGDQAEIRIYGYGPQEAELLELASQTTGSGVRFMGPLERDGLAAALDELDVFVLPCVIDSNDDMDGLPTVIGEAMAAGVPVVTTSISAIGEVVADGTTGFIVPPRSPGQLATKIAEVLAMPAESLGALLAAAAERAASIWDAERTGDVLLDAWLRPPVEIALVTHSRFDERSGATTAEIIRRIYELTSTPFAIRIVDNDSDEAFRAELTAAVAGKDNARLTLLDRNVHWGPGLNLALAGARSDQLIYVCSNEGFVLRLGWERSMLEYMRANRNVAIAGHRVSSPGFPTGAEYVEQPWFAGFRNKWFAERQPEREFCHVQGGIFVLRRSAYERCGGFSERTAQAAADVEYSHYLESLGWNLGEVSGIPSVTKKTRPGLGAHLDEATVAAHPLDLDTVGSASVVARGESSYCNVCGWTGEAFGEGTRCPRCASTPFGRLLFRYLAGTPWPFRGIDCLAALDDAAVIAELEAMFTLSTVSPSELDTTALGEREMVIADLGGAAKQEAEVAAISGALTERGVAIIGLGQRSNGAASAIELAFERAGCEIHRVHFKSSAVAFPDGGLVIARRREGAEEPVATDG